MVPTPESGFSRSENLREPASFRVRRVETEIFTLSSSTQLDSEKIRDYMRERYGAIANVEFRRAPRLAVIEPLNILASHEDRFAHHPSRAG
jgi:hypothetical protein